MTDPQRSAQSSQTAKPQPSKPKGINPWEGLTTKERARRIAKMQATREAKRVMAAPGRSAQRRLYTDAEKLAILAQVDAAVAGGMLKQDAARQAGIHPSLYHNWHRELAVAMPAKPTKNLPAVIRRPPAHEIEVLDVPAPRNGHRVPSMQDRMARLAALIIEVEKLL